MGEFFQGVGIAVGIATLLWLAVGLTALLMVRHTDIPDEVPWGVRIRGAIGFILLAPYIGLRMGSIPRGIQFVAVDSDGNQCPCPSCQERRRRNGA